MLLAHSRICNPTFAPTYFFAFPLVILINSCQSPVLCKLPGFFLSHLTSLSSIKNHLSSLRCFYELLSIQTDLYNDFYIHFTLHGIQHQIGNSPQAKLPITPQILHHLHSTIDLGSSLDVALWTACLVAFFTFFWKSKLFPVSAISFDSDRNLTLSDVQSFSHLHLSLLTDKDNSISKQKTHCAYPHIPGSILCPVSMLQYYFHQVLHLSSGLIPLFLYQPGLQFHILTYPLFLRLLWQKLSILGYKPSNYSGHSFRRSGTSFTFSFHVPHELIQQQGDWNSNAYLQYLSKPLT